MESDEDESEEQSRPLIRNPVVFDASHERAPNGYTPMPLATQAVRERDTEDVWAEIG